jgi:2-polyprenyl-6-methoxyphenol hydroxylase-like FAD-dependent oxidoreductase
MKSLNIAVVGAGTAGLAACLYLHADGHQVQLFERAPKLTPLGAGLLMQPTGLHVMRELGLLPQLMQCGARLSGLQGHTVSGRRVMDMRYAELGNWVSAEIGFGLGVQRGALFEVLRQALPASIPLHLGSTLTEINEETGTLRNIDQQSFGPFDLIVLADGTHSQLRAGFSDQIVRDQLYPWGAVWCLLKSAEPSELLRQRYRAASEMCGLLPVGRLPGEAADVHKLCLFWSLPVEGFAMWEMHGLGNWRSKVYQLWPEASDLLMQIQHPNQVAKSSYRDVLMRRWYKNRVVLIGDSAHGMSPQLGQGANMALLDARELSRSLTQASRLADALANYQSARASHLAIYQRMSRWLTPLFQSDLSVLPMLRDWFFYPLSRLPGSRAQSLKILAGVQRGLFGRLHLD